MKHIFFPIVILAALLGCGKQTIPVKEDVSLNIAEPRQFHGSDIVNCKIIHQQHRQKED